MGWLIALGVLILLASIPLGVALRYSAEGFLARVILGPVRLTVYPRPPKEKKETKQKAPQKEEPAPTEKAAAPASEVPKAPPAEVAAPPVAGGSLKDFLPFVNLALDFLGSFRRKLRVNLLELKLTMAADDPCDLAVHYGRAWAAVGNLIPQLERIFVIKKRDVEVRCDFASEETILFARLELTITLGRLLGLTAVYGVRAIREYLNLRKKRKGGAAL